MSTTDAHLACLATELFALVPLAMPQTKKQQMYARAACSTLRVRWGVVTVAVALFVPRTRPEIARRCIELIDAIDLVRPLKGSRRDVQRVLYAALVRERDRVTTPAPMALAS